MTLGVFRYLEPIALHFRVNPANCRIPANLPYLVDKSMKTVAHPVVSKTQNSAFGANYHSYQVFYITAWPGYQPRL